MCYLVDFIDTACPVRNFLRKAKLIFSFFKRYIYVYLMYIYNVYIYSSSKISGSRPVSQEQLVSLISKKKLTETLRI